MAYLKYRVFASNYIFSFYILILLVKDRVFLLADESRAATSAGGSQLCAIDVSNLLPPPYGNVSYKSCMPVWHNFVLRYHQSEDNTLNIVLSAVYTTGWVGMGFSKDGLMVGSSAMVGWFNKKGQPKVLQYYLRGTHPSQVIPNKGELPLSGVPAAVALGGANIYLAFQLKLTKPLLKQPVILAFGTSYPKHHRLTHHDAETTINVHFDSGSMSLGSPNIKGRKRSHGILGIMAWGLILPIGAIVARYFRHKDPMWYYAHTVTQFVGFIIGLAGVILGTQLYSEIHLSIGAIPAHRGIGIFALTLSIVQVLGFFLRPNKDAKIRKYWNWYHSWAGRLALFFGAVNIALGIQVGHAGNEWKIGYGFLVSLILVGVIILEILHWMKRSSRSNMSQSFQMNPIEEALPNPAFKQNNYPENH